MNFFFNWISIYSFNFSPEIYDAIKNIMPIFIFKDKELIMLKKEKPFLKEGHTLAGPTSPFGGSDPQ
jgi:hypothetical protein